jgi:tetratricopeptide (TPR) repeat protein
MKRISAYFRQTAALLPVFCLVIASSMVLADYDSGMEFFKAGKYAEAAAEFQVIVEESPDYDYGYFILGMSFAKMNKPADAVKNLKKAMELNGDRFDYPASLAKVYYGQRNYPQVISVLTQAEGLAQSDKHKYTIYQMRGLSKATQQNWAAAITDLEAAQKIRNTAKVSKMLGQAYFKMGYNDKAARQLRTAIKSDANDASSQQLLAEAAINLGKEARSDADKKARYTEALKAAKAFRAAKPGVDGENLVGRAALGTKDYSAAEAAFKKVVSLNANHCFALINLGNTYIGMESWGSAVEPLNKAIACDPNMAVPYEKLGFVYQKQGSFAQAKNDRELAGILYSKATAEYQKALELDAGSSFAKSSIATIASNVEVMDHNTNEMIKKAKNEDEIKKAEAYNKAEEEKRKAWEERQKGNGGRR